MTAENQNYERHILKYAIEQSINCLFPNDSQEALNAIVYRSDEIVWRVATEIYTKKSERLHYLREKILPIKRDRIEPTSLTPLSNLCVFAPLREKILPTKAV